MKKQNKKQGFTLVELLVVIAILAILATVSIVGYTAFIKKAHESNALAEANQIKEVIRAELIAGNDFVIGTKETTPAAGETLAVTTTYTIKLDGEIYIVKGLSSAADSTEQVADKGTDLTSCFQTLNDGDLKDLFADGNKITVGENGLTLIYTDSVNKIYVEIDLNADTAKLTSDPTPAA